MKNQESKSLGELWLLLFKSRTKNIFWGLNSLLELSFGARSCGDLRVMCYFKPTSCFHLSIDHKQRERHHLKFYIASLIRLSIMHHEDPRSVPWSASKIHRQPCKTSFFQPFPLVFPQKDSQKTSQNAETVTKPDPLELFMSYTRKTDGNLTSPITPEPIAICQIVSWNAAKHSELGMTHVLECHSWNGNIVNP